MAPWALVAPAGCRRAVPPLTAPGEQVAAGRQQASPAAGRLLRAPVKIAEGVYLLGDLLPSAVYVVDTAEGLVMIDSGLESAHEILLGGMSKLGLDPARLKVILLTHAHGDHTMGAQRLRAETGAKIYIGREDAEPLRRGGPWQAVFSGWEMQETLHPTTVDGELTDQQVIELGQARFTVVSTPGHTPGSCCYLLELDGQRMLFTGDTLMTFHAGTGTYAAGMPPRYRGDVDSYLDSLEKLRLLPLPDYVLPGHPASERAPPNPRLSASQWVGLLDLARTELEQLRDRYALDGADFLDGHPKEIGAGLYFLGDFERHAAYALVSERRALLFGGARGRGAAERLDAAWQTLGVAAPAVSAVLLTSCEPENLTGLDGLVRNADCKVLVPNGGLDALLRLDCCPPGALGSVDELPALGWPGIHVLPIAGAGEPQAAYSFECEGATVLVTGSVPIDIDGDEHELALVFRQGPPPQWNLDLLADSLDRLEKIFPHVWLSAFPLPGRNANLYNRSWMETISMNRALLHRWQAAHGP